MTTMPNNPAPPPPGGPYAQQPAGYAPAPAPAASTNTMAVLALVFAFVFSPLGIVFGFIGRSQIKRTGQRGRGLATAGIVLGAVFILIGVIAVVVAVVAVSNLPLSVSKEQVAQQINAKATSQLGTAPDSVTCPSDLPAQVGASIQCTLTISGAPTPVTATVTSVTNGVVNFDING